MNSSQIRQSFLDFFHQQRHTIVPSSSLLPDSPGLLFTNAGMNQFVPIFLNERKPDVSKWAGVVAAADTRAADTQKCIRAGGKHNDLEDVGFDTYHHTFFEMLGNWSFGDYFKKESISWGWELLTKVWGIPAKRLFATVYSPNKAKGDPADFDQEAWDIWAEIFRREGLDPEVHIVHGNKKDNFWMMGDTGPCGPCSEIHFNLLPSDEEAPGRALVNSSSPRCIEIWNHVFIQFNANADGSFSPLPAKHVDTGMGFERVAGIHASTQGFKDFSLPTSNYAADVFAPLFDKVAALSGKTYTATVPEKREGLSAQEQIDIAFRVLADHARTVSCAIADGILPGNDGRNYVIRRILRRGILYGKKLDIAGGFFEQLVAPVVQSLGPVFPELVERQEIVRRVIRSEEESFGRTLDRGLAIFNQQVGAGQVSGKVAFELYDTYGFPLDMTQLLATERGLTVDEAGFQAEMEKQRERARAAQKKEIIAAQEGESAAATPFVGYALAADGLSVQVLEVVTAKDASFLVFDRSPFYGEMGGQIGDRGTVQTAQGELVITDTIKDKSGRHLHKLEGAAPAGLVGQTVTVRVDLSFRTAISRHHSATHLLHWALRGVLGTHVRQAGSSVTDGRLRFDYAHFEAASADQLREIERRVNRKVLENAAIAAYETPFDQKPEGTLAFFGEKYGAVVRVVDIGGYSRELCGGTHVGRTGEIGLIKIVSESAVAAGTRRLEAVAGEAALEWVENQENFLRGAAAKLGTSPTELTAKLEQVLDEKVSLDKALRGLRLKAAAGLVGELKLKAREKDGLKILGAGIDSASPDDLRTIGSQLLNQIGEGVVVLGSVVDGKASIAAFCSPAAIAKGYKAGDLIRQLATQLGGKGGGKPDFAMGGVPITDPNLAGENSPIAKAVNAWMNNV